MASYYQGLGTVTVFQDNIFTRPTYISAVLAKLLYGNVAGWVGVCHTPVLSKGLNLS